VGKQQQQQQLTELVSAIMCINELVKNIN